jgi:transposase-like protein
MQTRLTKHYDKELKVQVEKECIETNNYAAVSSKHDIPVTTIYGWIKSHKNKQKKQSRSNIKELEFELKDVRLENRILKELLKKSHQLWLKD